MPRPLRINYPNAWYHVMNRGAGKQKIFKNDTHRMMFIDLLNKSHQMFNIVISAYCLMDNHYHLLLSTPEANLPRVMRHINGVYTQLYNRSQKKDGSLFRGRYKAKLIEDDCYQLVVSRYIHLNPVDAGVVENPADYKWSSYKAYIDMDETPIWLSKDIILKRLSEIKLLSHIKSYQNYVEMAEMDEINVFSSVKLTKPIIGSEVFKEKILSAIDSSSLNASHADYQRAKTIPSIDYIKEFVCSFYCIEPDVIMVTKRHTLNWPRLISIYICRKMFGYSLCDIAEHFGSRCPATISTSLRNCDIRLNQHPNLLDEVNHIYQLIKTNILNTDIFVE